MNLAWIVPRSGKAQARNVHAKDRAKLKREGYMRYRLECGDAQGGKREADVYAQRIPTAVELTQAAQQIFGAAGELRLVDESGKAVPVR